MTHQEKEFRDGNILSLLIRFSIPATFAILIGIIYNVTDRYYIGQAVGRNGISALAVTFPILLVLSATGVLFSIGGCALAGIKMGEEKIEDARKVLGTCFFALITIGAVYTIFGMLFLEEIVSFMGATENSFAYAVEYNKYLFPVTIFQLIYITYCSFVRLEGRPMESMIINLASAVVNIVLDYILIMRYGMGMKGAAIATAIANVVPGIILIYHFLKSDILTLKLKYIRYDHKLLKKVFYIGNSGFLNQFLNGAYVYVLNIQLAKYGGDVALAGMGILSLLRTCINTGYMGLNQGRQPLLSYNWGAKNYERVKKIFYSSITLTAIISFFLLFAVIVNAHTVVNFFVKNDLELTEYTIRGTYIHLGLMISTAIYLSCTNYFQAVGKGMITTRFIILRLAVLSIPLTYILPIFWGADGVLLSFPAADTICCIGAAYVMWKELKLLTKKAEKQKRYS